MTDRGGRIWGVILVREEDKKLFGEEAFEIKDSHSVYEAAMVVAGRHPWPRTVRGADIDFYRGFLTAGINEKGWRRVRPQRSVEVFHALMDEIEQDKIKPTRLVYLTKPTDHAKGDIDWRFTRVKTADVARICAEKGWHPKSLSQPPTGIPAKRKGGRKPICDQEVIREEVFRLMDHHGEFSPCDPDWNCQAKLEKAIATFLEERVGVDNVPVESTIRNYIKKPLAQWQSHQNIATAKAKN